MKHIVEDSSWRFGKEPFPAYRCSLVFGRNKRDFQFLPTKVSPEGEDKNENLILPEGQFQIIKTKEKGTILVVPGEDKTARLLLMAGISDGFRGNSNVLKDHCSGIRILKLCGAHNNCEGHTSVACVLEPEGELVFRATGRRTDCIRIYKWNGESLSTKTMTTKEFECLKEREGYYEVV